MELPAEQAEPTQDWAAENADLYSITGFSHKASPFSAFDLGSSLAGERAATAVWAIYARKYFFCAACLLFPTRS